jgi:hypothetical protein
MVGINFRGTMKRSGRLRPLLLLVQATPAAEAERWEVLFHKHQLACLVEGRGREPVEIDTVSEVLVVTMLGWS